MSFNNLFILTIFGSLHFILQGIILIINHFYFLPKEYVMHFVMKHQKKSSQGFICCKGWKILLFHSLPESFFTPIIYVQKLSSPHCNTLFEIYEYEIFADNNGIVVVILQNLERTFCGKKMLHLF